MELKQGYKQTEVGVIPEEWDVKRLGEIGKVVRGGSPRPAGDPKFFDGDFIPWLTVAALTNIPDHQLEVRHTESRLTEEGSKRSRTLQPRTVIIANSGATLGVAKISAIKCCANDGVAAIIDQHIGDKAFICHCINAQTQRLREVVATGNGQPNLNTGLIKEIAIPWPPQAEQTAIAECFSDLDKLLQSLENAVVKKYRLKQAAMQELLTGKRRLPGFEGEWEVRKLGDYIEKIVGGGTPSRANPGFWGGEIPWATVKDLTSFQPNQTQEWLTRDGLKNSSANLIPAGTLIASTRMALGKAVIFGKDVAINQDLKAIFFGKNGMARFFCYWFEANASAIDAIGGGSTVKGISLSQLKALDVASPGLAEQNAIVDVISDLETEIETLENRLTKTRALKQAMMQELLTGRIRLR